MKLIGLTGPAGSGKGTAAKHLTEHYHGAELTLAEPLYEILAPLLQCPVEEVLELAKDRAWKEAALPELRGRSPRQMLQLIGDILRQHFGEDYLIRHLQTRIADIENLLGNHYSLMVISDIRTDREAEWLRRNGGQLIHLHRDEAEPVADHHTEHGVQTFYRDVAVKNNGCIEDLHHQLDTLISVLFGGAAA